MIKVSDNFVILQSFKCLQMFFITLPVEFILDIILPKVFEILQHYIKVSGGFYDGDLLDNVLQINEDFWEQHKDLYNTACMLIKNNMEKLSKTEYSTDKKLLEDATAFLEMKG